MTSEPIGRRLSRRLAVVGVAGMVAAGASVIPVARAADASATTPTVKVTTYALAGPGSFSTNYLTPVVVASIHGTLVFRNEDVQLHNVVSTQTGSNGLPLFSTPLIGLNKTATVSGLASLQAGKSYTFYCTIHPGMHGTLKAVN